MDEKILARLFPEARGNVKNGLCADCAKSVTREDLIDEISKREFDLSGLCQKCQDDFFVDEDI